MKHLSLALLALLSGLSVVPARAAVPADLGGQVQAQVDGTAVSLPLLKTDIDADIQGDLAEVRVTQTFANPLSRPVHATYLFPLHDQAAVHAMSMEVGDERIQARIQRVEQARATFEQAKQEGKSAALLNQHRPNMFTQDIANLMPGVPIKVTLSYAPTVPRQDGAYELVIPLVVGPRYQPQGAGVAPGQPAQPGGVQHWQPGLGTASGAGAAQSQTPHGQWELEQLPAYAPVAGLNWPGQIDPDRVGLAIHLNGGMPVADIGSPSHPLSTSTAGEGRAEIRLANGRTLDNRDFVLRYRLAGSRAQAGLLAHRDDRGGFFSLLLEPPQMPAAEEISPREMVFVLDCSGSMAGLPLDASKAFMRAALRQLRPTDSFRIIRFSDSATEFSAQPLSATPANVQAGLQYTDGLHGEGGTEMSTGIRQALTTPVPAGALRIVTFLTDGYIGNEVEILKLIKHNLGDARLFAFGVGTGVNRYLLNEMGRVGRGFTRYMDPTEDQEKVAQELASRLQSPLLTDIRIDWGDMQVTEASPESLPDLFAGQSLRIQGRYGQPGRHQIKIQGRAKGRPATLSLLVELPDGASDGGAVPVIWARSRIADFQYQLSTQGRRPGQESQDEDLLKRAITQLGLDFALVTPWTSFVAVSEQIRNPDAASTGTLPVPLPQVQGVAASAYGKPSAPVTGAGNFLGSAAPEPEALAGLTLLGLLLGRFLGQRAKNPPDAGLGQVSGGASLV